MTAVADMLAKLIAFDTVSSRSNLGLIHFIRDLLAEQGIPVRVMAAPDGQPKANLWATIGPDKPGGIVLSGRLEVTVDDERRILGPGDAYYFESRRPHRFRCVGPVPCEVISACTPPSF